MIKSAFVAGLLSAFATLAYAASSAPLPISGEPLIPADDRAPLPALDSTVLSWRVDICQDNSPATSCEAAEGSVEQPGRHRLLRFDTVLNSASAGPASTKSNENPYPGLFVWSLLHRHYHLEDFTSYQLLQAGNPVAQGITASWGDAYNKKISGQWIDITGIPAGDYELLVEIDADPEQKFGEPEGRYANNKALLRVSIPAEGASEKNCR